ncbi:Gfo/Idh/MocA family protein [Frigoribacterium sp. CG_9.8]|uniref:Gfo/Idh/MocA family protein n=1 Tax=Frigoribacterium sp. CG_9.8 TaxID=2787733 RepID=UPI0018C8EC0D|nr:Gfo/Idh/MocA family oxidoreductase [Frigoribacterium sp. CG_9.8]MBG6106675.1 putative dehydrogenase [Frigoribacterium sp. CG_9.8]
MTLDPAPVTPVPNPLTPIRWGILGTGFIAHLQTADLLGCGFTVAAVGSRSQGTADAFAAEFAIPTAHGSYEALVADPDVDAIYISTPHPFHAENALLALGAGKHVLVEKAFTLTAREALAVVEAGEAAGLVVMEAMWTRFLPHMLRIREIIAAGTLGDVRTLIADHNQDLPKDPLHRLNNPALGGGALLDLGIYPVSFAFDLFGTPTAVAALATKTATGVDRQTAILLGFDDGRQAVLHSALDTAGSNTAVIIGTEGRIEVDAVWYSPTTFTVFDAAGQVIERFDTPVAHRGMQFQAWEFERRIREGDHSPAMLPARESVRVMETLDAVRAQIGLSYPGE